MAARVKSERREEGEVRSDGSGAELSVVCAICTEGFRDPRLLKGCGHSYCYACILLSLQTGQGDGDLRQKWPCPLCRRELKLPSSKEKREKYVRKLAFSIIFRIISWQSLTQKGKSQTGVHASSL